MVDPSNIGEVDSGIKVVYRFRKQTVALSKSEQGGQIVGGIRRRCWRQTFEVHGRIGTRCVIGWDGVAKRRSRGDVRGWRGKA